mgnify:CR=1 FL=1
MKVWIQRVVRGAVEVEGQPEVTIGPGFVALVAFQRGDTAEEAERMAERTVRLRIFDDEAGKMNRSLLDVGGAILAVPQFTLYAETDHGHRPGFSLAAPPDEAAPLFDRYVAALRHRLGPDRVRTGRFRSAMRVTIVNDGPVSIELKSRSG